MLFSILVFVLVLGWIIFFHEMGHFLAAKACNVYVERFSLGFPPRLFGVQRGETDYCVGLLFFGGYVKMAGQEDVPLTEEERQKQFAHVPEHRLFMNRPVWQRFLVIAAGPFMNLVLGILLYGVVALVGANVPESSVDNRIGAIEPDFPATTAPLYRITDANAAPDYSRPPDAVGWETGDRVLSINGETIASITDVAMTAALAKGKTQDVLIERTQPDGSRVLYHSPVAPQVFEDEKLARFGIAPFMTALVQRAEDGMPAQESGIEPNDVITRANGKTVDIATVTKLVEQDTDGNPITFDVLRDQRTLTITLVPQMKGRFPGVKFDPPLQWFEFLGPDAPLKVGRVTDKFTQETGLRHRDVITAVEGQPATPAQLRRLFLERPADPLNVAVDRPARLFGLIGKAESLTVKLNPAQVLEAIMGVDDQTPPVVATVAPEVEKNTSIKRDDVVVRVEGRPGTVASLREMEQAHAGDSVRLVVRRNAVWRGLLRQESQEEVSLPDSRVGAMGVVWDEQMRFHQVPLPQVAHEAYRQGVQAVRWTVRTVTQLIRGGISPTELGGPLTIFRVTSDAARLGLSWLLKMTAFISINLFVLNILPLPVLDGGILVFLIVEKIRRKPLELWVAERIQKVGLVLIVGIMLYVTYNDILRMISDLVP